MRREAQEFALRFLASILSKNAVNRKIELEENHHDE